jgi:hypothetical protein
MKGIKKTVTAAGTAEALSSDSVVASSLMIRAMKANTGAVFIGHYGVSSADNDGLEASDTLSWDGDLDVTGLDLADIYVDAAVNGEGVNIWYVEIRS